MELRYPGTMHEFFTQFPDEQSCREYLANIRWGESFKCPHCKSVEAWVVKRGMFRCTGCVRDVSVKVGTFFEDSRIPLHYWFQAAWFIVSQKYGVSALGLARMIGMKRTETAWKLLRKIRGAMVLPGREKLSGIVEVDEVFLGGVKPGKRGRGAHGKVLILVLVEDKGMAGFGRIRIVSIPNAKSETLVAAIKEVVELGSTIRTDKWPSYPVIKKHGYDHVAMDHDSFEPGEDPTPLVHRIASLLKRWLLGTHQGGVWPETIAPYLDEFVFRFNRRTSRSRGKLFYTLIENLARAKSA